MAFKFPFTNYHELNLTWILEQLKSLFEKSEENITTIETYNDRLTAVETEIPGISETASEASRASAAAGTVAQTAKATADTAQENAIQAQTLAGTARQEAQTAQTAANEATQAAQTAQATAQNFDGRITQAESNASSALEASRSFENRVNAAINTANNAATTATNAQGIAIEANQKASQAVDNIGDMSELETINKNTLVAAINEAARSGGGGVNTNCAPIIINTASGGIASFTDGADNKQIRKIVGTIVTPEGGNGWTEANVEQRGTNIFNKNGEYIPVIVNSSTHRIEAAPNSRSFCIPCKPNTTYTLSGMTANSTWGSFTDTTVGTLATAYRVANKTITTGPEDKYLIGLTYTMSMSYDYRETLQIEVGNTASVYEAYRATTLLINWQYITGAILNGVVALNEDGSADVIDNDSGNSYHLTNVGSLYTYFGTNNIWIETGIITECKYPADTKLYIDNKISELQALILEN